MAQPIWLTVLLGVLGAGSLVGGIAAIIGARASSRLGVSSNERQARADEATAEDRIIGRWENIAKEETTKRIAAEQEAAVMEDKWRSEREYNEVLRRHIWEGKPWPPPAREQRA